MRLWLALLCLVLCSSSPADEKDIAATVVLVSGEVLLLDEAGQAQPVELGQLLAEGDRVRTGEGSALHLVLADGSSLALGPNTELSVSALSPERSFFELIQGVIHAIVERLSQGSAFEIRTAHAVAAVKGTEFEVRAGADESAVIVQEGEVEFSDPSRTRRQRIPALHRAAARRDRLERAFRLPRRELLEFQTRWERARVIHARRQELLRHFLKEREARLRELRRRRMRLRGSEPERPEAEAPSKERRQRARQRFEKAREEIRRERMRK